ncbi:Dolichyl-phosphate-mannose-protein mannosyltransferase [Halorientalis persicus]|uniref:Dolichyl-phosphate-mannose-protein mannosyltransferase n=1 Tax=Halorientalis persicus TaxID=1367881 RepID=A0A1H8ILE4_9EURY|nr:glycosyltransferase family 39 protein [Halorientalis persicus]SEN68747.1 Dolichyl-phosphate-mannose-protein mannosyltransferase [Halorientalis persicus]
MGGFTDRLRSVPVALYGVVVLAAGLRLYSLGRESYWLDEIASLNLVAGRTLPEVLIQVPTVDRHPPLYYALLKGWIDLFGTGEVITRLPAVVFGVAAVVVIYGVGARLYDRQVGLLSATLLAVARFHINHSQATRMYSLFALLTLLSFYLLVRVVEQPTRRTVAGYALVTVLLLYTHAFALFVVLAQNVFVVGSRWLDDEGPAVPFRTWLASQAVVGLAALPWVAVLLGQALSSGGPTGLSWIPEPTVASVLLTFGGYVDPWNPIIGSLALLLVGGFVAADYAIERVDADGDTAGGEAERAPAADGSGLGTRGRTALLGCWIGVVVFVPVVISYVLTPIYVARYTIGAAMGAYVLLAALIRLVGSVEMRYIVGGVLVVAFLLPLPVYYTQDQHAQWDEVSEAVGTNAAAGDVILISQPSYANPFEHYVSREDVSVKPLPASASTTEIRAAVRGHDTVWLVTTQLPPDAVQRYRATLEANRSDTGVTEFRGLTLWRFDPGNSSRANETDIRT